MRAQLQSCHGLASTLCEIIKYKCVFTSESIELLEILGRLRSEMGTKCVRLNSEN